MTNNDYAKTAEQQGIQGATPSLRRLVRQNARGVRTYLYGLQSPRLKRAMLRLALAVPVLGEMYCTLATPAFRREIRDVFICSPRSSQGHCG